MKPTFSAGPLFNRSPIERLTRCHCYSSASSRQTQTTATDEGSVTSGRGTAARDNAFAVGSGASYTESGSLQVRGGQANLGNISAEEGSTVNVGLKGEEVSDLLDRVSQASREQIAAFAAASGTPIEEAPAEDKTGTDETTRKLLIGGAIAGGVFLVWRILK